jgi:hypothetical protein
LIKEISQIQKQKEEKEKTAKRDQK